MKYKLIALDLDGTLKTSENQISPRTKEALMKAQEMGVKLVLSSGRPTPGLYKDMKELEMEKYDGYLLSFNGAKVSNCKGDLIYTQTLDAELARQVYLESKALSLEACTYTDDVILCENENAKYVKV